MNSVDLATALRSYDQVFRRIASYAEAKHQKATGPVQLIMLVDESGVPVELEANVEEYTNTVETFLQTVWLDLYGEVRQIPPSMDLPCYLYTHPADCIIHLSEMLLQEMPTGALQVKVVLVKTGDNALLAQAKASLDEIMQQESSSRLTVDKLSQGLGGAEQGSEGGSGPLLAGGLAQLLTSTWNALPENPRPVLSKVSK